MRQPVIQALWLMAGLLALALGILGAFLPLLPTTPFVILAAACFARSSERLHGWLLSHSVFGPAIRDWQQHRAISRRGKRAALVAMAAVFVLSLVLGVRGWILAAQGAVLLVTGSWIATRPDAPRG